MGRLIDADKLRYKHSLNIVNTTIPQSFPCITKDEINNAPTIEAVPKDQINKAIEKIEQYICDVETDTVKAQGMTQALDMFEQTLGELENGDDN